MDAKKRKRLEEKGWRIGTAEEFLGLTDEEALLIEIRLDLADALARTRKRLKQTQAEVAGLIGSSQSRLAKMEAGDPSVSLDLLIRSMVCLGVDRKELAEVIASSRHVRRRPKRAAAQQGRKHAATKRSPVSDSGRTSRRR